MAPKINVVFLDCLEDFLIITNGGERKCCADAVHDIMLIGLTTFAFDHINMKVLLVISKSVHFL
jgi:hypothetical protein